MITLGFHNEGLSHFRLARAMGEFIPNTLEVLVPPVADNQVALLVDALLKFNDMQLGSSFVESLARSDELALSGGLVFVDDTQIIGPGCCADFQDWPENLKVIRDGESPWMGHDPSPWIEYVGDKVIVWSNAPELEGIASISFESSEIDSAAASVGQTIISTLSAAQNWATKSLPELKTAFLENLEIYLRA